MKKTITLFTCILLGMQVVQPQVTIEVKEESKTISRGDQPAFIVDIPGGKYETIRKEWIKFLETGTKLKVQAVSNELNIQGAVFKKITLDSVNVYSSVYDLDSNIRVIACFELDSVFLSTSSQNPRQNELSVALKSGVRDFAVGQYVNVYEQRLNDENTQLKTLESERKEQVDAIEKNQKSIKGNEENIRRSEESIHILDGDMEIKNTEIKNKKAVAASLKSYDPEGYKVADKELGTLEREKKKMENQREKEQKKIVEYKNDIKEAERSIGKLEEEVESLEHQIADQQDRINQIEKEKSRIK
jgi:peptidoglycan hydrolase CwlO-like protein